MKYYLYVSEPKVEMLYAQISADLRKRIEAELKIDFKIISTTLSKRDQDETKFSKLKVVVEYIQKNEKIGTVDKPEKYFCGILPMRYKVYEDFNLVYFGGETKNTFFGLGGSSSNMIGGFQTTSERFPSTMAVIDLLNAIDVDDGNKKLKTNQSTGLNAVTSMVQRMQNPTQRLEFLAKRLTMGSVRDESHPMNRKLAVLGSPIYVSVAE